jgi:hypothetical protein
MVTNFNKNPIFKPKKPNKMNTQEFIILFLAVCILFVTFCYFDADTRLKKRIDKLNYSLKTVTYKLSLKTDQLQELQHSFNKLKQSNNAAKESLQAKEKWLSPTTVKKLLENPPKFKIGDKVGIATIENIEFRNYNILQKMTCFLFKVEYELFNYIITVNEAKTIIPEHDLINTYQVARPKRTALKTREV